MLLSCGIANAQTAEGTDAQTSEPLKGDLNGDGKVNAADVTVLVGIIMNTDYFLLGTDAEVPNKSNYTTFGGVVTTYKSIDDVLEAAPKVSLKADQRGVLLCPESWDVKDLVLQNEGDGTYYALAAADTDISDYNLFQTEKVAGEAEYVLKTKAEAEAYVISITDYFLLDTEEPTKDNYTTLDGVVTTLKSLADALKAALTVKVAAEEAAILFCPSSWVAEEVLVLQDEEDGTYYELSKAETDITDYALFQTEKIAEAATLILKTKADAEKYLESLNNKDPEYFWLGNTYPTKNNFPTLGGKEQEGIVTTYTSLADAMAKASRVYAANEQAVVLYPSSWGDKDDIVFLDAANKKYYEVTKKNPSDFPDYKYYETVNKIGVNTAITLSTESEAKAAGATLYVKPEETPVVTPVDPGPSDPDPVVIPTPPVTGGSYAQYTGGNGIRFVITNNTGVEARLNGKLVLNVSRNPNVWPDPNNPEQVNANLHAPTSGNSHAYNDIIIAPGGTYTSPEITTIDGIYHPNINYTDGSWYLMNNDNGPYVHSIYLYSRMWSRSKQKKYDSGDKNASPISGSNHMYVAAPPQNAKLQRGYTYYLNLYWKNPEASLAPDLSGSSYVILAYGKTGL